MHHGERRGLSLVLAQVDRLFELSKLGPNVLFQASEAVLLRGIVHRQSLQPLEARPNFPYRRVVRIEVTVLASEQIATLAGFGIFHRGKYVL